MFTWDEKQAQVEMTMCKYLTLVYRGYYMAAQTYRDRSSHVEKNLQMSEIFFQHDKRNFGSPSSHVMFYLLH